MSVQPWAVALVIIGASIGSLGPIFFKKASAKSLSSPLSLMTNYYLMFGLFFYGISTIIFIPALKGGHLSLLYPLVSVSYIFVSFLSQWILKEKMNTYKWSGIVLIIIGISILGASA